MLPVSIRWASEVEQDWLEEAHTSSAYKTDKHTQWGNYKSTSLS